MKGIFIEIKDIQKLYGCSYMQAWRKMQTLKDITGSKNITVKKFCNMESITTDEFHDGIMLRYLPKSSSNHSQ